MVVGRKLTKALRGKRRWVGVAFRHGIVDRAAAAGLLRQLDNDLNTVQPLRLMDFAEPKVHGLDDERWLGILCVRLEDSALLREALNGKDALVQCGMQSLTTSGKIRLVRERLALPKPKRRR